MLLTKLNIKQKIYLKVFVDDRLPVRFDLSELWPQSFDLALHSHDILKVPLRPQVQHLDWLRHVLHLLKRLKQRSIDFSVHHEIKMSSMFSRLVAYHALTSQGTNQHFDLWCDCLLTIHVWAENSSEWILHGDGTVTWQFSCSVFSQILSLYQL